MRLPTLNRCRQIYCLGLVLAHYSTAFALTVISGPQITPGETSACILWKTDVEAGTRVQYGTNEKLLDQRATSGVGAEHKIDLTGLQPGTQYYFSIGSARVLLSNGSFQTLGRATLSETAKPSVGASFLRFLSGLVSVGDSAEVPTVKPAPAAKTEPASVLTAPPARQTWRQFDTLEDHYERHGADFRSVSKDHYATQAWLFLQRARQSALPMKWDDADDTLRVWESKTRTFAAYDSRGRTRTFFKPSNPDYWNRQPGRSVKPAELPFN